MRSTAEKDTLGAGRLFGIQRRWGTKTLVSALLLILHLAAVCRMLPPERLFSLRPVLAADFPVHIYHADFYRRALQSGSLPWGYDPAVAAGKTMLPTQDAGGRLFEYLAILAPWLSVQVVARVLVVFTALSFPLWMYLAARHLGIDQDKTLWVLLVLASAVWLYPTLNGFMAVGMVDFALASFVAPLALALFLKFLQSPGTATYLAFLLMVSFVFATHVLGVAVLIPPLAACVLCIRELKGRFRLLALSTPLWMVGINFFWFIPFVSALGSPSPPGREFGHHPSELIYTQWSDFASVLSLPRMFLVVVVLSFIAWGVRCLTRTCGSRVAWSVSLAVASGLLMKVAGSVIPGLELLSPNRFMLPAAVFATIPMGLAAAWIARKLRVPNPLALSLAAAGLVGLTCCVPSEKVRFSEQRFFGGQSRPLPARFPLRWPGSVAAVEALDPVVDFAAQQTECGDRLLVQTAGQCEQLLIPHLTGREVIGTSYTDQHDPIQFHYDSVLGRRIAAWQPAELREALSRWGVNWVFAFTPQAKKLFARTLDSSAEKVGPYLAFRCDATTRLLVGEAAVSASPNRIALSDIRADGGWLVLKYRYHPAWEPSGAEAEIYRLPLPEDEVGLLAIKNPGGKLSLVFRPWKMLSARWSDGPVVSADVLK